MADKKIWGTAIDVGDIFGANKRDGEGRVTNRSTAYDIVRRLPDSVKMKVGRSLRINLPKLRELDNSAHELDQMIAAKKNSNGPDSDESAA